MQRMNQIEQNKITNWKTNKQLEGGHGERRQWGRQNYVYQKSRSV